MATAKKRDPSLNLMYPESQDMFRRLIEHVQSGVYIAETEGNLVYVNHAFVNILGYNTKDELLGRNLAKDLYVHSEDRDTFLSEMSKTGSVCDYEVKNRRKDGSVVTLSVTSNLIRDEKGGIIGSEGVVHDISDHKKLEKALLREKEKLEEILDFDENVGTMHHFDVLMDFVIKKTTEILEVNRCSIMLVDSKTNELYIARAKGMNDDLMKRTHIPVGQQLAGRVAKEGRPLLVRNIEYDQQLGRPNHPHYASRSLMIVPIKWENGVLGVINVTDRSFRFDHGEVFNTIDLKILSAIARELAVALDNLNLYKELQKELR